MKQAQIDIERLVKFLIWIIVIITAGVAVNFLLKRLGVL